MPLENIVVKGAREHNLKNIDVVIPRGKLVVITGVSGSGKSTLAFNTIYAEGQRRYVESLSAYARQFLGLMDKPDVDYIEGLSPAIAIDQKWVSHNPRSTVGTVTEVYDYLRLLFARVGRPHCHNCGRVIARQTIQQIVDAVLNLPGNSRIMIMAPKVTRRKGEHKEIFEDARRAGFVRVRVNGIMHDLSDPIPILNRHQWHSIEIVVDRLVIDTKTEHSRVSDSVETALKHGDGVVAVIDHVTGEERLFSEQFACVTCGTSLSQIEPRTFSFNSPHGACPSCTGLGFKLEIDPDLVIPDKNLSLSDGAVMPWVGSRSASRWYSSFLDSLSHEYNFSTSVPVNKLKQEHLDLILYGNKRRPITMHHQSKAGRVFRWETTFEGVIPNLERRYRDTSSDYVRHDIERYMSHRPCPTCNGKRLKQESLAITVCGKNIMDISSLSTSMAIKWIQAISGEDHHSTTNHREPPALTEREMAIANQILKEIETRLKFLVDIGLGYLSVNRAASTLSGGESQRIRLATQIGSGLMGVLYVCDEPSVGLHPIDDHRLIGTLKNLRDLGNTIIIVEHDEAIIRAADHIIDLGPGAGEHGGYVVITGPLSEIVECPESITGAYLSGRRKIPLPQIYRHGSSQEIVIRGARENNLKNIDVPIPLGKLVAITGASGSGKSTLIYEVLYKKLAQVLYRTKERPGDCDSIDGIEHIDKVVNIDQSPIGRTPRSNPATYTGAFTHIRELFAAVPESRARGYAPGRFSFNVKGGRCEACSGGGYIQIEMQFLPNVTVPCEVCRGKRYNREALEITFKEKNIADVLAMTVEEAFSFFENFPRVKTKLRTMLDVGLGYIRIGQPATTLSGGEAQRVKLSTELSRRSTGKTLYILDEPTTGLSFEDCAQLLQVLHKLVDSGNTVALIEHQLDLIKNADWVIDLGPGGGDAGGYLVAIGTPEAVANMEHSYTGQYLKHILARHRQKTKAVLKRARQ